MIDPTLSSRRDTAAPVQQDACTPNCRRSRGHWLRWMLLAVVLLAVAGALVALPLRHYIEVLLQATQALGFWGYLVLIGAYIVAALFFVPGSLLTLAAGFLYGVSAGLVVVSIGSTLGAAPRSWSGVTWPAKESKRKSRRIPKFHCD